MRVTVNVFAVWNPFVLFVYMAYTLPFLILGFYLYPIKIVVRISAILTAALCIIGISYVSLFYFEKCLQNLERLFKENTICKICKAVGNTIRHPNYEPIDREWPTREEFFRIGVVISAAAKFVASVIELVCFGFTGYLLHHIIFVFTNAEQQAVIQFLNVLPLIVVSLSAYMIRHLILLQENRRQQEIEQENRRQQEIEQENRRQQETDHEADNEDSEQSLYLST